IIYAGKRIENRNSHIPAGFYYLITDSNKTTTTQKQQVMSILGGDLPTVTPQNSIVALIKVLPPYSSKQIPPPDQKKWEINDKSYQFIYPIELIDKFDPIDYMPPHGTIVVGTVPEDVLLRVRTLLKKK